MPLGLLLRQVFKLVIIILLGVWGEKIKILPPAVQKGLSEVLLKIAIPATIILSGNVVFSDDVIPNMIQVWVISMLFYLGVIFIAKFSARLIRLDHDKKSGYIASIVFANVAFIGYPFAEALYGSEGVLYTSVNLLVYSTFMWTYGIYIFSGVKKIDFRNFINACTIATFIMIVLFLGQIKLPEIVHDSLSLAGSMTIPLSMLLIGASLSNINLKTLLKEYHGFTASVLRLFLLPLLLLLLLSLFNINKKIMVLTVTLSALPSGSLNIILAQKYECNPDFVSRVTAISMILFLVSMPIIFKLMDIIIF